MSTPATSEKQRSWTWLFAGAALLPFTQFQTILPPAAWLAAVFLLRFSRTQRARVALPVLALVHYGAAVISMRGGLVSNPLVYALGGVFGIASFAADRALGSRLTGWARTLVFPTTAVGFDWLFGLSSLGTAGSIAYTQWGTLPLIQLVSVTGIWGLVFLVTWLAPAVNEAWERGFTWPTVRYSLLPISTVLAAAVLLGSVRLAVWSPTAPTVRVAALADNRALSDGLSARGGAELAAGTDEVRDVARAQYAPIVDDLFERTRREAEAGAKIVSWSEVAAFTLKEDEPALIKRAQAVAREHRIYLQISIKSTLRTARFPFAENRAILIDPAGKVIQDYSKAIHPLGDAAIFARGPGVIPIVDTPYGRLATVICFDVDFPALVRQAGQGRADILLAPSKDWQPIDKVHARVATFRAVENGVALVRATGDGISVAVDHLGQPLATADYFATDNLAMVANVPIRGVPTIYARIGDSFVYLCVAGLVALAGAALLRRRAALRLARQPA